MGNFIDEKFDAKAPVATEYYKKLEKHFNPASFEDDYMYVEVRDLFDCHHGQNNPYKYTLIKKKNPSYTDITATVDKTKLVAGETIQITSSETGVKYTSSNEKIATVSEDGLITAVNNGRVIITVSKDGEFNDTTIVFDVSGSLEINEIYYYGSIESAASIDDLTNYITSETIKSKKSDTSQKLPSNVISYPKVESGYSYPFYAYPESKGVVNYFYINGIEVQGDDFITGTTTVDGVNYRMYIRTSSTDDNLTIKYN